MIRPVAKSQVSQPRPLSIVPAAVAAQPRVAASSVSSFGPASPTTAQAKLGAGPTPFVALPSLKLGGPMDQPIQKEADAIAKELWLGKYQQTAGGDGEVWRVYAGGSVDGDVLGHIRGVWMGGAPWSQGSTFLPKNVVDRVMKHHLGGFLGTSKSGDLSLFTFMNGTVAVDKAGKVSISREAIQLPADQIARELGLGAYTRSGGGDGEEWRTYAKGTVDGDMFGNVRGVWMGGTPWSQGSTFLSKKVVDAAVTGHLGHFQSSQKVGEETRVVFAHGVVTVDAKGNVSVSDRA